MSGLLMNLQKKDIYCILSWDVFYSYTTSQSACILDLIPCASVIEYSEVVASQPYQSLYDVIAAFQCAQTERE